jgi:hypothetical protein
MYKEKIREGFTSEAEYIQQEREQKKAKLRSKKLDREVPQPINQRLHRSSLHPEFVKEKIILKSNLPSCQRSRHTIEDYIISRFPNVPSRTSKDFHEARSSKIIFCP